MAEGKKSFQLYTDQRIYFDKLSDQDAGQLIKHLFAYVNDENPTAKTTIIDLSFEPLKQQLKRDLKRYRDKCKKNSESARKRWNKDNANASERIKRNANDADKDKDKDKDKDINISFELFWDAYGKKVDRSKAEKKWGKLTDKDREDIMAVVGDYVQAKPDPQYRPNPTTFLNNRRWEDDIKLPPIETKAEKNKRLGLF